MKTPTFTLTLREQQAIVAALSTYKSDIDNSGVNTDRLPTIKKLLHGFRLRFKKPLPAQMPVDPDDIRVIQAALDQSHDAFKAVNQFGATDLVPSNVVRPLTHAQQIFKQVADAAQEPRPREVYLNTHM